MTAGGSLHGWPARLALALLLVAGCTQATAPPPPFAAVSAAPAATSGTLAPPLANVAPPVLDGTRAKAHLDYLAHPARGGRYTGSQGFADAAAYVVDRFREIGLEPLGDDGTFLQRFQMPIVTLAATPILEAVAGKGYVHRRDFTELVGGNRGSGAGEGELIFVGAGSRSDFATVSARGNVVLIAGAGDSDPLANAIAEGAVAAIIASDRILKYSTLPRFDARTIPTIVATEATVDELIAASGKRLDDLRRAVDEGRRGGDSAMAPLSFATGARVRVAVPLTPVTEIETYNVVGLLRGGDPDASKRAVLVGGHLDGVGTDPDGTVFPGANDNASGPAVTIEIARALAARKAELRHSVVFVAFSGEEEGLYGSEAYASRMAAIPGRTESLIAYLNLDVVGCCGSSLAASPESPSLYARIERVAGSLGLSVATTRGSSDHVTFARRRVDAAILLWSNTGPLHTPHDTADIVDARHLQQLGDVAAQVVFELARDGD
ncbi:MAG: M28 family peptidase [Candidatus Limnocylindria bacterium]